MCCLPYCLSSLAAFPTLIHYDLPSENSVSVQKLQSKNKNSNLFFKNTRERNERLHQCGSKSVSQAAQCAWLHIYVTALLLLFNSLFGWIPSHTGINPCRDTSEFCKCALCVINCCQTRAAQAAFWQQANMLSAGCRLSWPLNIFCLCSLHDPSLTESRTSSQRQYKKPLKKSGSKHKFTGRLAKTHALLTIRGLFVFTKDFNSAQRSVFSMSTSH